MKAHHYQGFRAQRALNPAIAAADNRYDQYRRQTEGYDYVDATAARLDCQKKRSEAGLKTAERNWEEPLP